MRVKRGFTLIVRLDIESIRNPLPPERHGGLQMYTFAVRVRAKDQPAALALVGREFNYPEILAAFNGWPECFRGEVIKSREHLCELYGPGADVARERANMEAALTDPQRNPYLSAARGRNDKRRKPNR